MFVALVSLFVALTSTGWAQNAVPLAKRALVAENAKKLGGRTSAQLLATANNAAKASATAAATAAARQPGPASTAAGLTVIKTGSGGAMPPGGSLRTIEIACDTGQKVVGGGMSSDGAIATFDSYPKSDAIWEITVGNLGSGTATISVYAICLR